MLSHAAAVAFLLAFQLPAIVCAQAASTRLPAASNPASTPPAATQRPILATKLYVACGEFALDVFHNAATVPITERRLLRDVSGSTVEEVNITVREGDWLVFHVVQNRLRRGGARYFAVAGVNGDGNVPTFVSDSRTRQWWACDDPLVADEFIANAFIPDQRPAARIKKPWEGGDALLRNWVVWKGEPIWGDAHETWIKFIATAAGTTAGQVAPADAQSVVFICDATGTMLGLKFELQKKQLLAAIDALPDDARFNVIFFRGGDSDEEWAVSFANGLRAADEKGLGDAEAFIDKMQVLGKGTNPLPALKLAFAQRPKKIFFLTDGQFDNVVSYEQVLAAVRRLNRHRPVVFDTIAFMSEDDRAEATLERLARENGGRFRKVSEKDLKDQSAF